MNYTLAMIVTFSLGGPPDEAGSPLEVPSVLLSVQKEVFVPARVPGTLTEILVRDGQQVSRGELLARLEDDDVQLAKQRAEIELEIVRQRSETDISVRLAEKTLLVAQAELKRADAARQEYRNSIPASEMDRLRLTVDRDLLGIEQARFDLGIGRLAKSLHENELQAAVKKIERCQVYSPLDGTVVEVHREEGEWVEPGETVFRIIQLDPLQAEAFLDARCATWDLPDRPVRLTVDSLPGPARTFAGRVVFVSPEVDPVSGQFLIRAEIENRDLILRPGIRGKMTIDLRSPPTSETGPDTPPSE